VDSAQGTAHVLAAPLMVHHKPHKLHYLAASHLPATPKRLSELVASAYATVAGGSQVAYHDHNAAQALPSPPDAAASAWASFLQGRSFAGAHGSGDAAWSSHVFVDAEEAPTVATAARKAKTAPYPGKRSSKSAPPPATVKTPSVNPKVAQKAIPRRGNGVLGSGRLKALTTAAMVVERLNIVPPRLLQLAPTVMLGIGTLISTGCSSADEAWLQAAARRRPTAATRTLESQLLKEDWPVGQHWSMDALPTMPHLDPRDGAGLIIAELVSKHPFVIFVAGKTQASFVQAMEASRAQMLGHDAPQELA
jgi:hypothetical protein